MSRAPQTIESLTAHALVQPPALYPLNLPETNAGESTQPDIFIAQPRHRTPSRRLNALVAAAVSVAAPASAAGFAADLAPYATDTRQSNMVALAGGTAVSLGALRQDPPAFTPPSEAVTRPSSRQAPVHHNSSSSESEVDRAARERMTGAFQNLSRAFGGSSSPSVPWRGPTRSSTPLESSQRQNNSSSESEVDRAARERMTGAFQNLSRAFGGSSSPPPPRAPAPRSPQTARPDNGCNPFDNILGICGRVTQKATPDEQPLTPAPAPTQTAPAAPNRREAVPLFPPSDNANQNPSQPHPGERPFSGVPQEFTVGETTCALKRVVLSGQSVKTYTEANPPARVGAYADGGAYPIDKATAVTARFNDVDPDKALTGEHYMAASCWEN